MGEVYRARDTQLNRDVAIKVLLPAVANDPDRLARFAREAQVLASLNHPHIAHVYGLEAAVSDGGPQRLRALVMELVEGEDLAQRIGRGPLPLSETLSIARQLVDGIASAHEHGVIHRDLKPANIRVTADGTVKILDFGLAKAVQSRVLEEDAPPTVTGGPSTSMGGIFGTAAYMSPEQARGQAVDTRTDVWAFACVVYEMLTGRRAFPGATSSDAIAAILEREPAWEALPASTPPSLRRLLTRCLDKDPKRRLRAIADAQFDIADALVPAPSATAARDGAGWPLVPVVLAAIAATALVAVGLWQFLPRFEVALPAARVAVLTSSPGIEARPTFSPDGAQVAFAWDGGSGNNEDIHVVIVGSDSAVPITRDPARDVSPAWKPDGSEIAFARLADGRATIHVVSPLGQSERKLAEFSAMPLSPAPIGTNDPLLAWSPDGLWLAVSRVTAGSERGIFLVAHDGSARHLLLSGAKREDFGPIAFSPRGNVLAYVESAAIRLADIDAGNPPAVSKPPRPVTGFLGWINGLVWTADGQELVYGRALYAAPSPSRLWRVPASAARAPEPLDIAGVAGSPALSPRSRRLAFSRRDMNVDIMKLREGGEIEMLAASTFSEFDASFSPDGSKVAFASDRTGEGNEIWVTNADGTGRRPVTRGSRKPEGSPRWSPDGRWLAYDGLGDDGSRHIYVIDHAGGQVRQIAVQESSNDQVPSWSRDGNWIYFGSNRSGKEQNLAGPGERRRPAADDDGWWRSAVRIVGRTHAVLLAAGRERKSAVRDGRRRRT